MGMILRDFGSRLGAFEGRDINHLGGAKSKSSGKCGQRTCVLPRIYII